MPPTSSTTPSDPGICPTCGIVTYYNGVRRNDLHDREACAALVAVLKLDRSDLASVEAFLAD